MGSVTGVRDRPQWSLTMIGDFNDIQHHGEKSRGLPKVLYKINSFNKTINTTSRINLRLLGAITAKDCNMSENDSVAPFPI